MQAFHILHSGSTAELHDISVPKPGPGQVLLKIAACGLNFADLLMEKGTYQDTPDAPFTLGMEVSGTIDSLGAGVMGFAPGQRVAVFGGSGGLAEYGLFDANRMVQIPDKMSFEEAAAFQVAYGTSHLALDYRARLQPSERLLVLGAAGGVGLTAVEIGNLMGAEVIAVARGAEKLEVAKSMGATHLIDASEPNLRGALKTLGGVDVVYDPVGGDLFKAAFRACNPEARILPIGFASGSVPQIPANHLLVKNISVIGLYWGGYLKFKPKPLVASLQTLFDWFEAGKVKPHVSYIYPLAQAADAMEILRARKSTGKVVVTMS